MKKLFLLTILCLFSSQSFSQQKCSADLITIWTDCFGAVTYTSGNKYVGEFKNDKPHGLGTFTWASDSQYIGEWKDGSMQGQGTYTYANGEKYFGEWEHNKWQGQGVFVYDTGDMLVGSWDQGEYKSGQTKISKKRIFDNRHTEKNKISGIYNACILDKSHHRNMQIDSVRKAVEETCKMIAKNPSWTQHLKYERGVVTPTLLGMVFNAVL